MNKRQFSFYLKHNRDPTSPANTNSERLWLPQYNDWASISVDWHFCFRGESAWHLSIGKFRAVARLFFHVIRWDKSLFYSNSQCVEECTFLVARELPLLTQSRVQLCLEKFFFNFVGKCLWNSYSDVRSFFSLLIERWKGYHTSFKVLFPTTNFNRRPCWQTCKWVFLLLVAYLGRKVKYFVKYFKWRRLSVAVCYRRSVCSCGALHSASWWRWYCWLVT